MFHMLRKLFKQPPGIPDYRLGPQYDLSGARSFVYQREFSDPLVSPIGPANRAGSMRVTQQPQVYFFGQNITVSSIAGGGLQAGSIAMQPLGDGSNSG